MKAFAEDPFIVERAEDIYLYDDQGKQYIDGLAGVFVGHANASVIERAARERGLVVRGATDMVSLAPPLTITHEQIDDIAERLRLAIGDVMS